MKSKLLSFMSCTPRRQQANSVTENRQQAGDVSSPLHNVVTQLVAIRCSAKIYYNNELDELITVVQKLTLWQH